jgi:hypothetical protein
VRQGWRDVRGRWQRANLQTPLKVLLLVGAALALIVHAEWLVPLGIVLGSLYLIYFGVYSLVRAANRPVPTVVQLGPVPAAPQPPVASATRQRRRWQDVARQQLRGRTACERCGELSGSLLMAALVAGVASLVMLLMSGKTFDSGVHMWVFYAWLTLTSVIGAWSVLVISKLWETSEGDQVRRRFAMLLAGMVIGLASYGISEFLHVQLSDDLAVASLADTARPKLSSFLVYFAGLFAAIRWWLQADPLRATRLSVWSAAACVLCAWFVHLAWPFPQPWGFMLAISVSAAVQLAAPWVPSQQRSQIRRQVTEA